MTPWEKNLNFAGLGENVVLWFHRKPGIRYPVEYAGKKKKTNYFKGKTAYFGVPIYVMTPWETNWNFAGLGENAVLFHRKPNKRDYPRRKPLRFVFFGGSKFKST